MIITKIRNLDNLKVVNEIAAHYSLVRCTQEIRRQVTITKTAVAQFTQV